MDEAESTELTESAGDDTQIAADIGDVSVVVTVQVGSARTSIRDLMGLSPNAVLVLDSAIEDPVALYAGGQLLAHGDLQEVEGPAGPRLALRITQLAGGRDGD